MKLLALPAPSIERDQKRLGEYANRMQRAVEINRKAQADLDKRIKLYRMMGSASMRWEINVYGAKSRKTRLYFVSSCHALISGGNALMQSATLANSPAMAKRIHRASIATKLVLQGSKEINIAAWAPGEVAS